MKNQQRSGAAKLIIAVVIIVLVVLALVYVKPAFWQQTESWVTDFYQTDEKDDDEAKPDEAQQHAALTVTIDDDIVQDIGVSTTTLTQVAWAKELQSYAVVTNSKALVDAHTQLLQQQSAIHLAQVATNSARDEYDRLQKLTGAVAQKNVSYAKADWLNKQASLDLVKTQYANTQLELTQSWGDKIASWLGHRDTPLEDILSRKKILVEVALPITEDFSGKQPTVFVSENTERWNARPTEFVSPNFVATSLSRTQSYYYLTTAKGLRPGMRLHAWLKQDDTAKQGFFIPNEAIIWYAGQPWCYVQQQEGVFKRRALAGGISRSNGIFMESGFAEGDELVISGAQMLLSEEFRWQIHDEDDD